MSRRSPAPGSCQREISLGEVGPVGQIPFEALLETGHRVEQLRLHRLDREERHQPDQRTHPQGQKAVPRGVQDVVEKFVRLVPEPDPFAAGVVHGPGDPEEVLEKFRRDIFVNRILSRQLERGPHHR